MKRGAHRRVPAHRAATCAVPVIAAVAQTVALTVAGLVIVTHGQPVTADPHPVQWRQPYGGCKEAAAYPHTRGWRECRRHGLLP